MNKVQLACKSLEGDLAGKFIPLEGMKRDVEDELKSYHFLFKEGDRFL
jgi:hypothetical protein